MINNSDKQVGLHSGGGDRACIWNEVSVSTCGGLIHRGLYSEVYGRPQSKMFALARHCQTLLAALLNFHVPETYREIQIEISSKL